MKRRYLVVYEKGKRNYSGFAPDLPGCVSTGKTLEDMRSMMKEAVEFHVEGICQDGEPVPDASTTSIEIPFEQESDGVLGYFVEWIEVTLPKIQSQTRRRARKAA